MYGSRVAKGHTFELLIHGVAAGGEGVAKENGRAVFVPRALPGERVRARVVHVGARRVVAEPLKILLPSADRIEPPCPVYERCGGCQLMHARYPAQLRLKQSILADTLRSIAGISPPSGVPVEVHPAPSALAYRNRGQYPLARIRKKVVTGFFAQRSHQVVAVDRCRIHDGDVDEAVRCVRAWAQRQSITIYDERRHRGFLRHVVVRSGSGGVLVTLVGRRDLGGGFGDLVRRLRRRVPRVVGLVLNVNPGRTNVILGKTARCIWGQPWVEERLDGLGFRLSSGSFFQVNTPQARALFALVGDFIGEPAGPVVDAYCGVGVLGLTLASRGHQIIGIEADPRSVQDAHESADLNRLAGAVFHRGRVESTLPRLVAAGLRPASVVLDPPRKGCDPQVLQAIADSGTRRVGYISCHPGTLARDLKRLFELGFDLARIEAVDMFPQTAHIEVFAGLVRT